MHISYCTTCKGRLWQLEQTLPQNIQCLLSDKVDLVILDYHGADDVIGHLQSNYSWFLEQGLIKYYRLTDDMFFDMSHAKNMVHRLATGKVLFNLDADNFIGTTVSELRTLSNHQLLLRKKKTGDVTKPHLVGTGGRIGYTKKSFHLLRGYDEVMKGLGSEDTDLISRAIKSGFGILRSRDDTVPIQNTDEDRVEFIKDKQSLKENRYWHATVDPSRVVNKNGYGRGTVRDWQDNLIELE